VLNGGAMDHQKPHSEDEVYYVASGRAKMRIDSEGGANSFDVCPAQSFTSRLESIIRSTISPNGWQFSCSSEPRLRLTVRLRSELWSVRAGGCKSLIL
jgi:hypothetical protein